MKAFGVNSPEEALGAMQAIGLKPEDVPAFLASKRMQQVGNQHGLLQMPKSNPEVEPIKLTRR